MQQFQNILVGVDLSSGDRFAADELSAATQEAIDQSLVLGKSLGAKLTFFAGIDVCAHTEELLAADAEHLRATVDDEALKVLEHIKQRADAQGIQAESKFSHGHGWEQMIRQVIRDDHDLVIIGTKQHTALGRTLFGTTGTKLLRYAPCPVWVTKPGLSDLSEFDILVADDLGDVGFQCLRMAINGGQYFSTRTHVVNVIEEDKKGLFRAQISDEKQAELRESKKKEVEQKLEQRLTDLDYRTLELGVKTYIEFGAPDEHILRIIEEENIDVLVMGTRARTGISGMLIGNTAERLLTQIPCSLLAVKPEGFVCPIKPD
ncbi:MAG: universal stress protein [Planctomycetaceae bacterium]|nr:universal stress protein [Planctomycetaceae bacterium]